MKSLKEFTENKGHLLAISKLASNLTDDEQLVVALYIKTSILEAELQRRTELSYKILSDIYECVNKATPENLEEALTMIQTLRELLKV